MVKIKDLLPVGSIVLLKGGEKRLMICGILQSEASEDAKNYDYLGTLYPEGHIGSSTCSITKISAKLCSAGMRMRKETHSLRSFLRFISNKASNLPDKAIPN